jgi:hypothetical protein
MNKEDEILAKLMKGDEHYISDDGFTKAVMQSLPDKRAGLSFAKRRAMLIFAATLVGCVASGILAAPAFHGVTKSLTSAVTQSHFGTSITALCVYVTFSLAAACALAFVCLRSSRD